jgi:GNAT superfamily N-acetyltransferase
LKNAGCARSRQLNGIPLGCFHQGLTMQHDPRLYRIHSLDPAGDLKPLVTFLAGVMREPPTEEALQATMAADVPLRRLTAISDARDALIGYCSITRLASAPVDQAILWIATHPHDRHQGIATALYHDACIFLRTHHVTQLRSQLEETDHASLAFAEHRGFTRDRHFFRSTLDLQTFDATPFQSALHEARARGIVFTTLANLGDTSRTRRRVYELNKVTAADIPGRGRFFSFEEYEQRRFGDAGYRAEGVILAVAGAHWVGLTQVSLHIKEHFAFNEMTGVLQEYRGQHIAQALKVYAISYAQAQQIPFLRTFTDSANMPILALNQKLGYQAEPGFFLLRAVLAQRGDQEAT